MTNNKKIAAVIVAAGFSSRIGSFKPLLPMGSSTIIETAINTFRSIGVGNIVVITGYNAEVLEAHIAHTDAI
ncbi:MAG TPA: NTP transferase domain-containing protein, partial [Smithellaceae bacterium]|nr:NTP transferase domain-containing protein [Smithellaceae bacterium]